LLPLYYNKKNIMAVNVNTVYTTVLYILNKEQRGYLTPQEFNSLGAQVQEEIFNSYFPDGNQSNRQVQNNSENNTEFFNINKNIAYKLYPFEKEVAFTVNGGTWQYAGAETIYNIGDIIATYNTTSPQNDGPRYDSIVDIVDRNDYNVIIRSRLTAPTKQYPIGFTQKNEVASTSGASITISPLPVSVNVNVLFKPTPPVWGFTVGGAGQYIYDPAPASSTNFELDISEQTNLIIGILKYAGVIINDPTVIQVAQQEQQKELQNEKS